MFEQQTRSAMGARGPAEALDRLEENLDSALAAIEPQLRVSVSGLYRWVQLTRVPKPLGRLGPVEPDIQTEGQVGLFPFMGEELSLDVDGRYPLMVASGTITRFLAARVHWIANLVAVAPNHWQGAIWYKEGDAASFPYTNVDIQAVASLFPGQRSATVIFSGGGTPQRQRALRFAATGHHPVEFEFDATAEATPVTAIQTHAHPNRPASLPNELLTMQKVYTRAGFDVKTSPKVSVIPAALTGGDGLWSDTEMHDAMQVYWSRFANASQWALWTLFARQHEMGNSLGGIMFDDIGPNQRQGTAIFTGSFISQAPAGDVAPQAWVERMIFWTACHEMGHCFNLAHSWQKSLGTPWIALANEPEARSAMNYPYRVAGGQTAFFADFEYRFSDAELLFMRHAPATYVQPGNADWFDHHGFEQANTSPEPSLKLELRVNRARAEFEFLESVVLDLKLSNPTEQPQLVDQQVLNMLDHMTVVIKREGKPARTFHPYERRCWQSLNTVLQPAQAMYESLFVSAGRNGWDIAAPGIYTIQIALHQEHEDIISNALRLRVAPPRSYDEEYIAQDYFSDDVGRILQFDGSRFLQGGLDTLREACARLPERRVAVHSQIALGSAQLRDFRVLTPPAPSTTLRSAQEAGATIHLARADFNEAKQLMTAALTVAPAMAAETLAHIDYHTYCDRFSAALAHHDMRAEAAEVQATLYKTLAGRKVADYALHDIKANEARYRTDEPPPAKGKAATTRHAPRGENSGKAGTADGGG